MYAWFHVLFEQSKLSGVGEKGLIALRPSSNRDAFKAFPYRN
ncbi:hypothetical protein HMPREF1870_02420 [Bacteroidales bacterium KA00344]|nr:hypothetical protein HMPREF1870_02420 [Bacteroidales bacterium KA00344]